MPYLFKLRQTQNVARTMAQLARNKKAERQDAGRGWQGVELVVLGKKRAEAPAKAKGSKSGQTCSPGALIERAGGDWHEHAALAASWKQSNIWVLAQAYQDRADAGNMFDELKNQRGWTRYTTTEFKRSQFMARLVALTHDWWEICTRMGTGERHEEAITTWPLLIEGVAQQTEHVRTVKLKMTSLHGKAKMIAKYSSRIGDSFRRSQSHAEPSAPGREFGLDAAADLLHILRRDWPARG